MSIPDPGPGRVLRMPTGETITVLVPGRDGDGGAVEIDALLPPGLSGPPRPRHRFEAETFTVVEGRLAGRARRRHRRAVRGRVGDRPTHRDHAFANPFDEPARIRMRETPAGPLEEQFRVLARAGRVPPLGALAAVNARHDLSFSLHGVPDAVQRPVWRAPAWLHDRTRSS
ncbi:hypothetical protein I4I73_10850 [Pseudonocardia sp. KRD-184]|uniref:Uncharacterized protein n=1 Tax=Pseudonocardia oceani TaxID=2792013 RepID=A0ABS6UAN6_9PSEU|nr:hypothetical protein [Pseudonocardia oceani]MBW0089480.1 hypothetical protein [Pseudonocardia oceani]MBW0096486.1 hypothetical protein [Pseudonocardia oceani]MBW0109425.1 hypothetical protein [Pseudonocardia oceani]MBW0123329.1 hypothetical protein [Pseudonocardia oceani]MBW0129307.1 hypothetical protein [Pseudonocardia oceani]